MIAGNVLLDVDDLKVHFRTDEGVVRAVDGVSFHIDEGETLGVVGESGSGKSVTSLAIMRLLGTSGAMAPGGAIRFGGMDLLGMSDPEMRRIRGNAIAMIYQEPMSSLNPVHTVGRQIAEVVRLHQRLDRKAADRRAVEMLELVGIPEPARRARNYPHEMSGGMRQRVMIAMALACKPRLLIADEPTTALDVTIQAQILDLMRQLQRDIGMSILFITHDLGVIAEMADRVVVMYAGRTVEEATVDDLFVKPLMPYTMGLLDSVPRVDTAGPASGKLRTIPGNVPNALMRPLGCAFEPRCGYAMDACRRQMPVLEDTGGGHMVRCHRWGDIVRKEAG
ncbi:ABC transporter ATP-binding protein [Meridianimarinicoccus sp. RP-17]|uniref:ABC transporter ATP-binding protein n=1 Tax=Meridianimarinicoccus zhengii TaxID=2056810 RepID=UPI000DAF3D2E|nr:ABC transporter ATP-binding protein [Phycocomes zhengii]